MSSHPKLDWPSTHSHDVSWESVRTVQSMILSWLIVVSKSLIGRLRWYPHANGSMLCNNSSVLYHGRYCNCTISVHCTAVQCCTQPMLAVRTGRRGVRVCVPCHPEVVFVSVFDGHTIQYTYERTMYFELMFCTLYVTMLPLCVCVLLLPRASDRQQRRAMTGVGGSSQQAYCCCTLLKCTVPLVF